MIDLGNADILDNDVLAMHISPTAMYHLYVPVLSLALITGLLHVQPRFADPWEEEPSLAGKPPFLVLGRC